MKTKWYKTLRSASASIILLLTFVLANSIGAQIFSSSHFNPNVQYFDLSVGYQLLAFMGDFAFFAMLGLLVYLATKRPGLRFIGLFLLSFFPVVLFINNQSLTLYYNNHISFYYLGAIMTNTGLPSLNKDFVAKFPYDFVALQQYYFFIPILLLSLVFGVLKRLGTFAPVQKTKKATMSARELKHAKNLKSLRRKFILALIALTLLVQAVGVLTVIQFKQNNWRSHCNEALLASQIMGFFPTIFFCPNIASPLELSEIQDYASDSLSYTNALGNPGSSLIHADEVPGIKDPESFKRLIGDRQTLNGIFKGKNILFIQLESLANFMLGEEEGSLLSDPALAPNMKKFFSESYQLKNFVHSVAQGHSSDAGFTINNDTTGVASRVAINDWVNNPYPQKYTLPQLLNEKGYRTANIELTTLDFYKSTKSRPLHYKYQDMYYFDAEKDAEVERGKAYNFKNIEDRYFSKEEQADPSYQRHLAHYVDEINDKLSLRFTDKILSEYEEQGIPYALTVTSLKPHAPFVGATAPFPAQEKAAKKGRARFSREGAGYISYINYIDDYFKTINEIAAKHPNTVIILYGDHTPTGYYKSDIEILFGRELSDSEFAFERAHILGAIHVPDPENKTDEIKGLLKGAQPHVRSENDIYKTVLELFMYPEDIEQRYYGANLLSNEASYAIDAKNQNTFADEFTILSSENVQKAMVLAHPARRSGASLIEHRSYTQEEYNTIWERVKKFKYYSDNAIRTGQLEKIFTR